MNHSWTWAVAIAAVMGLVACSGPEDGDHCTANDDCPTMCQQGGDFPDGICTVECESDADCESDWACVSDSGGICMPKCGAVSDCTELLGDQWTCRDDSREDAEGKVMVCFGT